MEEIYVYHSWMRNLLLIAVCFAFAALGIFIIIRGGHNFAGWYSIVFFGLGGLFVLGLIVKERITRKPFLIITLSRKKV